MGQFKPMVKMMTTEPSVELKLKKGGTVKMKKGGSTKAKKMADGGGALNAMMGTPALIGRPAVNAPVRAPGKPSMAARRKAMMAKPAVTPSGPSMPTPMKKGGKAEGGESKSMHMAEMSKMKGLEKELKSHESKPASKAHKGLKTGGVALGNAGGYKKGGKACYAKGGGVEGNVGGERGLAHAGAASDDDQVRGLQPAHLGIEVPQAGRQAGQLAFALVGTRRHVDGGGERRLEFLKAAAIAPDLREFI